MSEKHDRFERYSSPQIPFSIDREIPRCISECPAFCDVKGYLELIAEGKYDEAYDLITETITLPATLGRICERPCEDECKRGYFDEPIAIRSLKRFAGNHGSETELKSTQTEKEGKIAIIGSGPAGLTGGTDLSKKGYNVTIFEKGSELGGMLRMIPEYKLPLDVLDDEIEQLQEKSEMEIERKCEVGKDKGFGTLEENYDAILLATGLPVDRALDLEGSELEGVDTALSFLKSAKSPNEDIFGEDDRVLIIGGGNTAINAARTARRFGPDVKVVYRRSEDQMPAGEKKVKRAEEEGVDFVFLASPTKILGEDEIRKVEFDLMKLGEPDESGRRRPIPIEESEMTLKADYLIWAIGQTPDTTILEESGVEIERGIVDVNPNTLETSEEGVFAAGDIVRGPATAVEAIGDGHRAAESIDRFLQGDDLEAGRKLPEKPEESKDYIDRMKEELTEATEVWGTDRAERRERPKIDPSERERNFTEVKTSLPEESAVEEARRCLACKGCQIYPGMGEEKDVDIEEAVGELMKSTDVVKCIDCGECTSSCPLTGVDEKFSPRRLVRTVLTRIRRETDEIIKGEDIWECTTCGICNDVCPYDVDFVGFVRGLRELSSKENSDPSYSEAGMVRERSKEGKLDWITEDLEVSDEGDVYYFSGCLPYLDWVYEDRKGLNLLEIPRYAVKILNSIGIVPAVSEDEVCCGHDLFWRGEKDKLEELAKNNIEAIKETGAETVVFTCPEGLRTFKEEYEEFLEEEPDLEFVHLSEFLRGKDVSFRGEWEEEKLTYHDACRMKQLNIFDEPREALKEIPEISLIEMKRTKEKAPCCGVNAMSTCSPTAKEMQIQRLNEAIDTGANRLIVPCPKCWIHFDCELSSNPDLGDDFEINELTVFLGKHLTSF